jgi:hypothetical protein
VLLVCIALISILPPLQVVNPNLKDIKGGTGSADALFIDENAPTPALSDSELLVRVKVLEIYLIF